MRKLGAALLIYLGLVCAASAENTVGPSNAILCNKVANLAIGPTSSTQIIAGVAGQSIFICGYQITNTGASGTFSITYGTGSTCTSPTTLITSQNVTSTAPATYNVGVAQMQTAQGATVCITPSVATIASTVWYSQF
jgi:hypothetical protein